MKLSTRIEAIEGSRTARFIAIVDALRREGRQVISLAIGEPAFDTPAAVITATQQALARQETRYGQIPGLPALRAALAARFDGCTAENVMVLNGSKQALYTIFQALCDPGDAVILPVPCWVSFAAQVKLAGAEPVFVPTRDHQLDVDAMAAAVTDRTRAILINSPNNPTGAVYPRADLERIARLAIERDLWLVADEAYDFFVYAGATHWSLYDLPAVRDRLVVTRSFSKHFAMTGFRVGYAVGPAALIAAMVRLHSHLTGNVCTFAQHGALAALAMGDAELQRRREVLEKKRDLALELAAGLFPCVPPRGAFYLFPDVSAHLAPGETAGDFCARMLQRAGVAMVPGEDFGMAGHVRICFAAPEEQLVEAFRRLREAL